MIFFLQMVMLVKKSKEYKTEVKYGEKETVLLGEEKDRGDLIKQTGMLGKKGDAVWRYFLQIRITYTILKAQHFQNPTILIFIKLEAVFFFFIIQIHCKTGAWNFTELFRLAVLHRKIQTYFYKTYLKVRMHKYNFRFHFSMIFTVYFLLQFDIYYSYSSMV